MQPEDSPLASYSNYQAEAGVSTGYPRAPWNLKGQLYGSIWSLSAQQLQLKLPTNFKLLVNFGRASAFVGFVDYQPGSTLVYHELIAGVVVKLKGSYRFAFHVTQMRVDNEQSLWGGREIWGVPKEFASFQFEFAKANHHFKAQVRQPDNLLLATGDFQTVVGLPRKLKLPVPFPNLQMLQGQPYHSSGTFWSAIQLCRGGLDIPKDSPLAVLGVAGRKPLISFAGLDFRIHLKAALPV